MFQTRKKKMIMGYENIIFMKCGVHASEKAEQIVERKMREVQEAKRMFWGYGGMICHQSGSAIFEEKCSAESIIRICERASG